MTDKAIRATFDSNRRNYVAGVGVMTCFVHDVVLIKVMN